MSDSRRICTPLAMAIVLAASALMFVSCKKQSAPASGEATATGAAMATAPSPAAIKEAEEIFKTRCTPCHGPLGKGDGPASKGLTPKPRNFSAADWQKSVTDEHIEKIVLYGGTAVGKSPAMPANPDLNGKEDVVAALRIHVRGLSGR